jgi:phosphoribosyl 1,2-cyclic phosphodiesterase
MRFASLGSGSRGNATVVESGSTRLLLDCGFSVKETCARLARLELEGEDLTAIVVTHEHRDHIGGVGALARRFGLPVYMTAGTLEAFECLQNATLPQVRVFSSHERFAVDAIEICPFPVPHDAREPCQFVFCDGARRLGVLTDTGMGTTHIEASLAGCDGLLLECNHDLDMLARGPYPESVKQRVAGPYGHLDNDTAAGIAAVLDLSKVQHLVAMHLSETNNRPELARSALVQALGCDAEWVRVAEQDAGFDWLELDSWSS